MRGCRKAQYNALSRAAWKLADAGRLAICRYGLGGAKVLCCRPGYAPLYQPGGRLRQRPAFDHARRSKNAILG